LGINHALALHRVAISLSMGSGGIEVARACAGCATTIRPTWLRPSARGGRFTKISPGRFTLYQEIDGLPIIEDGKLVGIVTTTAREEGILGSSGSLARTDRKVECGGAHRITRTSESTSPIRRAKFA
jgi:hypothetical protein